MEDLNKIQGELVKVYGSVNDPPLLYADVNSHVGDFAVIKFSEDGQYYRVKIHEEFVNEAEVWFVDYGNVLKVPKREVLAPVSALSLFDQPTFGIYCQLSSTVGCPEKWEAALADQPIHVRINDCKNDLYFVTFTQNPLNNRIVSALNISAASNQTASQPRTPANPPSFKSPPVGKGYPPTVRAQTYTSWDTPPSQPAWNTPPTTSRRTEIAAPDTNWRSGSTRMANDGDRYNTDSRGRNGSSNGARSRPEDKRPTRLILNLQPRVEKEAPRALSPTPPAYPPQAVLANVTKGVEVVYVDNPMDFYCQLTEAIEPLDALMAQLSNEYAGWCHLRF